MYNKYYSYKNDKKFIKSNNHYFKKYISVLVAEDPMNINNSLFFL